MKQLKILYEATVKAYSTVLFSDKPVFGYILFASTFFDIKAGITGFLGVLFSNSLAIILGIHEDRIKKGLYGFNGLFLGLGISLYYQIDIHLILILLAAVILLIFITLTLEHILGYFFGLPVLSFPFVLTSVIVYLAFFNYSVFTTQPFATISIDNYFPKIPNAVLFYLKSLAAIFFQSSPWAGLIIATALLFFSRIAFLLSIIGYTSGTAFHILMGGNIIDVSAGIVGFNYILTAIAIGGIYLVPRPFSFVVSAFAAISAALISSFAKIFLVNFSIPVLAFPFNLVTLIFLYSIRLLHNPRLKVVDFLPGSPETNIDFYKSRLERFGETGIQINLPFTGKWLVSQGYSGKFTHKDLWRESLDFMAIGQSNLDVNNPYYEEDKKGALRKHLSNELSDYYTFGLPILAPADGKIVKIVNHLPDNKVGEMDTVHNWGNMVLIEHTPLLYSHLSHFQQGSIVVKEGDYVTLGQKIGLAGNSGRSPEPHIHLHFQTTSEVGSPTLRMPFTQYNLSSNDVIVEGNGGTTIKFNSIPQESEVLSNVTADFNLRNFFTLAPGSKFSLTIQKKRLYTGKKDIRLKNIDNKNNENKEEVIQEKDVVNLSKESWEVNVDFWGNRFLQNDKKDKLYYYTEKDYFACLNYSGSKDSALFYFFLSAYRIPFVSSEAVWQDKISYKYFSSLLNKLMLDILIPFTDKIFYEWNSQIKNNSGQFILTSSIKNKHNQENLFTSNLELTGQFPGKIQVQYKQEKITIVI